MMLSPINMRRLGLREAMDAAGRRRSGACMARFGDEGVGERRHLPGRGAEDGFEDGGEGEVLLEED